MRKRPEDGHNDGYAEVTALVAERSGMGFRAPNRRAEAEGRHRASHEGLGSSGLHSAAPAEMERREVTVG